MNGTEQKNHRTAVSTLGSAVEALADSTIERLAHTEGVCRTLVSEERDYVDAEIRIRRACCQERWDATANAQRAIIAMFGELRNRGFWSRLNWLFTGR